MKLVLMLVLSLTVSNTFSQNTTETIIQKTESTNHVEFIFTSNKEIDEFQEVKWENRFKVLHDEIQEIDIDHTNESVKLVMDVSYTDQTLQTILNRFNVVNYVFN